MTSEYNMIRAGGAKTPCVQGNGGSHPRVSAFAAPRLDLFFCTFVIGKQLERRAFFGNAIFECL
ncbi:hypothetical protein [Coprococcus comes]|uniref:hypothetical protein n=1 Tax=Coprococcus comes TaxID=410072 RepID=UPI001FAB79EF|nr:hypothetical protein [Coprococcus comes]